MRKVIIRADSNASIASGHIMRCLSIAIVFKEKGADVSFVTADENSDSLLDGKGFEHITLHSSWNNLSAETPQMQNLLSKYNKPLLLIDTYSITSEYVDALAPFATIAYLGSKRGYLGKLDVQINYCAKTEPDYYHSLYGDNIKLMLGLAYTPLREEFQSIPLHFNVKVSHILITTGNTDVNGYVSQIIKEIIDITTDNNIIIDVVVGRLFGHIEELNLLADKYKNVILHRNVTRMSELMRQSDICITACGNTILELAAARVPQIAFSMVEEQTRSALEFAELEMIDYCGEIYSDKDACLRRISINLNKYLTNPKGRLALTERAASFVDGKGCERIVNELFN